MSEQEAGENDIPPNAKYTKIVSAQRYCFQIIFLVSVGIFTAVGFFLASSKTSSQVKKSLFNFFEWTVETKERIIEMFTFENHYYSHEFILKDVNKHLPLNTRQN
ncbi:24624_t:CDS:2 [Gigaspora rosea]|nr:24624_t:CDS:2 [Gigaspora rosea]